MSIPSCCRKFPCEIPKLHTCPRICGEYSRLPKNALHSTPMRSLRPSIASLKQMCLALVLSPIELFRSFLGSLDSVCLQIGSVATPRIVLCFPERKRNVAVLDHMLDLSPHYTQLSVFVFRTSIALHLPFPINHKHWAPLPPPLLAKAEKPQFKRKSPLTRQRKQNNPIHHQHRPEHWHVEHLKPGTQEPYRHCPCCAVPKLELRQAANEGTEFLISGCW